LTQLLHQALDLGVRCAFLDRLGEPVLNVPEPALGLRQTPTVLDPEGDVPQLVDHAPEPGSAPVQQQPMIHRAQPEIHMMIGNEPLRLQRERLQRLGHQRPVARILDQLAPLFDHCLGKILGEPTLRQDEINRLAARDIAAEILGSQRHADVHAGPRVRAKFV
jgi:hypothetical protein